MRVRNILVLGAGELGTAILHSLARHPQRTGNSISLSVLLRPSPLASTTEHYSSLNISIITADITTTSEATLSSLFSPYDMVICCVGFVTGSGTQLKITRAVLAANVPRFIPWQFGVDYDVIGRGSAQDLFDEQLDVRSLLRGQAATRWLIISTGMFTSFLFMAGGIVDIDVHSGRAKIRALGSWENEVTVTSAEDIGAITAQVVMAGEGMFVNGPIFIAGDTVSYERVAHIMEGITKKPVERSVLTVQEAEQALAQDPGNSMHKYNVVFAQGRGVAWAVEESWNRKVGMHALTAEEWARMNFKSILDV